MLEASELRMKTEKKQFPDAGRPSVLFLPASIFWQKAFGKHKHVEKRGNVG